MPPPTIASGLAVCAPIRVDTAAGSRPRSAVSAVIIKGPAVFLVQLLPARSRFAEGLLSLG
jgi:hypothetical protein